MGNNPISNIIQGLGTLAELWVITFKSFKNQGMDDKTATMHTKGLMSVMVEAFYGGNKEDADGD